MQEYISSPQTVNAFQTPWNMTISVNSKQITGLAGQWLIAPVGAEPYFMDDIDFEAKFLPTIPAG